MSAEIRPCPKRGLGKGSELDEVEGLHLIASMIDLNDDHKCFVADFHQIYSLPITYLQDHASRLGLRRRLQSPCLEHFSQAFARFFMRVGLPSSIPPYK